MQIEPIYFDGDYQSWGEVARQCAAPNTGQVLAKMLPETLKIKKGEPLESNDIVRLSFNAPLNACLLAAAVSNAKRLNVLDFGGSLGISYFQNRDFLRDLTEVKWSIVELSDFVEAGRKHFESNELKFYETIEACLAEREPNAVVASGVLQYLSDPWATLEQLLKIEAPYVFIDRTGTIASPRDRLTVQHVPQRIYRYDHPAWWLSEARLLSAIATGGYDCLHDFHSGYQYQVPGAQVMVKGFICRKKFSQSSDSENS